MTPLARTAALRYLVVTAVLAGWSAPGWSAPAYSADSADYSLRTSDTELILTSVDDQVYVQRLAVVGQDHNWLSAPCPLRLMSQVWCKEQVVELRWHLLTHDFDAQTGCATFTFVHRQPALRLRSIWRARPGRGPVEHWIELVNESADRVTIPHQDSLALGGLRTGGQAELWWIKRGGSNASTQGGTFNQPVQPGVNLELVSNCEEGASPVPWLAVQVGTERGLYVGWEFSGLGRVAARTATDAADLDLAIGNLPDFKTDVEPGETFLVPPAFVGCYAGDLDEGSYSLHRFVIEKLRPSVQAGCPDPILAYNLYLDVGGNRATESDVMRSVETCRDLGFEAFMPDAMWFPETGDWRWDPRRFPRGITPIEQRVHESGMKMALWCAWTNGGVSEHSEALSVRGASGHPEWFNADFASDWQPGPFYGGQLCLADPAAQEWEERKTQWLVRTHKLDYLKHDCGPIVTRCTKTSHRHHYGTDASYWATLGYYRVQEQLRVAFPHLLALERGRIAGPGIAKRRRVDERWGHAGVARHVLQRFGLCPGRGAGQTKRMRTARRISLGRGAGRIRPVFGLLAVELETGGRRSSLCRECLGHRGLCITAGAEAGAVAGLGTDEPAA